MSYVLHDIKKIDSLEVDGLSGVPGSLAYHVLAIEEYFQNTEKWYGRNSSSGLMELDNPLPWTITANATDNTYGTEVMLSDGTIIEGGDPTKLYNFQRIFVVDMSETESTYHLQIWHGLTTFAEASLRTSTVLRVADKSVVSYAMPLMSPKSPCNYKLWARCKCQKGNANLQILIGIHTYVP